MQKIIMVLSVLFSLMLGVSHAQSNPTSALASSSVALININTADVDSLASQLDGIGPERAKAIVEYRENQGAFASVDDLVKVRGIGPALLQKNVERLVVE